ncbi:alanine--glyoxylate aminotransferase family protein [Haladaptatus sp. F3-133]|uniref:Alanine--glyoxylate aminotransferase family protein n=1 Tax=Halorutilus salinus TaxID=2487751 RepID=A0A9Q4C269_9EURY|nr:alanine--glyoxylate aminotransferase family protein [Halorutilus salinus]MCX2818535.1 alanine--glyoxylate aminotransferase family protein [Halorutilus salinus]
MEEPNVGELKPPERVLLGPGPSNVHPRVLGAMNTSIVGHLDPYFVDIMDEVQDLLRYVFRTDNEWTLPVSGTGSASMEAGISNLVEPGDTVLVPSNGYFGARMESMAQRAGGETVRVDAPWGEPLDAVDVQEAFNEHQPDIFGFVQAETSTGTLQPDVSELVDIAHSHDALTIVDTVTSLGGVELHVDDWGIDVSYSAAQKCISCPPGASPLTLNDDAMDKILSRETEPRCWYLDLAELEDYWGDNRSYHHTAPVTNIFGLREALRIVAEEGIEERWNRHLRVSGALKSGIEAMGLEMNSRDDAWLPTLNAVRVPDGVDDDTILRRLVEEYNIEISAGLGDLEGEILRIGCMGHSARAQNVLYLVDALGEILDDEGVDVSPGDAVAATSDAL